MSDFPTKDDIKAQAVDGRPITQAEASALASEESSLTGSGPIKGGAAATAQSLHDKQQNFLAKAGEVVRKPVNEVTKEDAAEVQRAEARAKGGPPGKGSTAADVQSVADSNAPA
ncbi:seed maturation pm25 [Fusarium beomiforme]|uniref:Seed maturation pm25 n=1 Tax=Fusarium beomiforme TaxID=44412 RepID=A0A9P5DVA2_9HYPO|nr:seed maturation pm25 [Fusarium beomiforme]